MKIKVVAKQTPTQLVLARIRTRIAAGEHVHPMWDIGPNNGRWPASDPQWRRMILRAVRKELARGTGNKREDLPAMLVTQEGIDFLRLAKIAGAGKAAYRKLPTAKKLLAGVGGGASAGIVTYASSKRRSLIMNRHAAVRFQAAKKTGYVKYELGVLSKLPT
jgi:hypothetical protein